LKVALWEYVDGMAANCEPIDVKAAALDLSRRFPGSKMNVDHIGREIKRAAKAAKAAIGPETVPISPRSSRPIRPHRMSGQILPKGNHDPVSIQN
jgi:hypothetical protein